MYSVTSESIQSHLQNNPQAEQSLFAERIRFDLIVYYDQNSSIETIGTPTSNLRKALEYGQIKRPPMMLMGGFDAWQATVGERGVFKFSNNAMGPIKEKRHWLKSSNASASVSSAEQDTSPMYDAVSAG
jgi:ubiquitin carboxyl-terminal hydrolase 8